MPAIYPATRAILRRLDAVQTRFLEDIGVDKVTALNTFHLAPLTTRLDIAMLGLIHRTEMGKQTTQVKEFFKTKTPTPKLCTIRVTISMLPLLGVLPSGLWLFTTCYLQ